MSDSWDAPALSLQTSRQLALQRTSRKPVAAVVRDDWDDDGDDDAPPSAGTRVEDSKRIWESANASGPMPQIMVPSTSAASVTVVAATMLNQPSMKILKRPGSSSLSLASVTAPVVSESLADKQARYEVARHKIFGSESDSEPPPKASDGTPRRGPPTAAPVRVLREPRGPVSPSPVAGAGAAKGFTKGFTRRRSPQPKEYPAP